MMISRPHRRDSRGENRKALTDKSVQRSSDTVRRTALGSNDSLGMTTVAPLTKLAKFPTTDPSGNNEREETDGIRVLQTILG